MDSRREVYMRIKNKINLFPILVVLGTIFIASCVSEVTSVKWRRAPVTRPATLVATATPLPAATATATPVGSFVFSNASGTEFTDSADYEFTWEKGVESPADTHFHYSLHTMAGCSTTATATGVENSLAALLPLEIGANYLQLIMHDGLENLLDSGCSGRVIRTGAKQLTSSFGFTGLDFSAQLGDYIYFTSSVGLPEEMGVWKIKSDGTNVSRVKQLVMISRALFEQLGDIIIFNASDGTSGDQLWKTDGTEIGTQLVKIISPGGSTFRKSYGVINGYLYFSASTMDEGYEMWKTDGSEANTVMVADINSGPSNGLPSFEDSQTVFTGGFLYFFADNGTSGMEIWKTEGTSAPIITADVDTSFPRPLKMALSTNGIVHFANDGVNGYQLWRTSTTNSDSTMIKTIVEGGILSTGSIFSPLGNGQVIFTVGGASGPELWVTDGSALGTTKLQTICEMCSFGWGSTPFVITGQELFYTIFDSATGDYNLWKSDGTIPGTILLDAFGSDSLFDFIALSNNKIAFFIDGFENNGIWLWDDAIATSTRVLIGNTVHFGAPPHPIRISTFSNAIYFSNDDMVGGIFPWAYYYAD